MCTSTDQSDLRFLANINTSIEGPGQGDIYIGKLSSERVCRRIRMDTLQCQSTMVHATAAPSNKLQCTINSIQLLQELVWCRHKLKMSLIQKTELKKNLKKKPCLSFNLKTSLFYVKLKGKFSSISMPRCLYVLAISISIP